MIIALIQIRKSEMYFAFILMISAQIPKYEDIYGPLSLLEVVILSWKAHHMLTRSGGCIHTKQQNQTKVIDYWHIHTSIGGFMTGEKFSLKGNSPSITRLRPSVESCIVLCKTTNCTWIVNQRASYNCVSSTTMQTELHTCLARLGLAWVCI